MFCRYCGAKVPDGAMICPNCGRSFISRTDSAGESKDAPERAERPSEAGRQYGYTDDTRQDQSRQNAQPNQNWQNTQQNSGWQNAQPNQNWQNTQQNSGWQQREPAKYQSYEKHVDEQTLNGYAAGSLVCGIIGFVTPVPLSFILSILAIVFGAVGKNQVSRSPAEYRGYGQAVAGIILGIVALVTMIVLVIVGVSLYAALI